MTVLLFGDEKKRAISLVVNNHYTHSVSSGKTYWFAYKEAFVALSIPANPFISKFITGHPKRVWELSRLWAPDNHDPNLLTQAISGALRGFRIIEPDVLAVVSYADPNAGHRGGVYRAASWQYMGQCEESRNYIGPNGMRVSRRAFHSGGKSLTKAEIEKKGFKEVKLPGKHRYVMPLCRWLRRSIHMKQNQHRD